MNTLNEEQRKEIEDKCFASWVAEIDPETKSTEITGKHIYFYGILIFETECLKIFNEVMETYSEVPNSQ